MAHKGSESRLGTRGLPTVQLLLIGAVSGLTHVITFALIVAVALAWWLDAPGEVTINWRGGQYYTSFAAIVFFTAFL